MSLPEFTPFPPADVLPYLEDQEWHEIVTAWYTLTDAHLSQNPNLSPPYSFLIDFTRSAARHSAKVFTAPHGHFLIHNCFRLTEKALQSTPTPPEFFECLFLFDMAKVYRNEENLFPLLSTMLQITVVEANLTSFKKDLVKELEGGINGDLKKVEDYLARLNHLLYVCPDAAILFLAGDDFVDGLISCFRVMNPPLRKTIIATSYVSLVGLAKHPIPKLSMLSDLLYSLKTAAEKHKASPLGTNDSMVAELISATPILKKLKGAVQNTVSENRIISVLDELNRYKNPGRIRPPQQGTGKNQKGKKVALGNLEEGKDLNVHRMSEIEQIHDLFPHYGRGFIARVLSACGENIELVVANLLEGILPKHLESADKSEELLPILPRQGSSMAPRATTSLPTKNAVVDSAEFDLDLSRISFGKSESRMADDMLAEKPAANKAAILSALAAFNEDDDERDDTYDVDDVGGTVDANNEEEISVATEKVDECLFKAFKADPALFSRKEIARNGIARARLRSDTGMTDEEIEGWALMLERNPRRMQKMERQFILFSCTQPELISTRWRRNNNGGPETENSEDSEPGTESSSSTRSRGSRGRGGRSRGNRRGHGGNRGDAAGSNEDRNTIEARRRKETNKSSRANHNRRNQRAKKMARGGGLPG